MFELRVYNGMRLLLLITASLALALGSSRAQRLGPDQGVYCAIGKVNGIDVYCPKPKLNGGWPAPYLFDREGISTEWKLRFFEDDFRFWPFVADLSFYFLLLAVGFGSVSRLRDADEPKDAVV